MKQKILPVILSLAMVVTLMPASAFAGEITTVGGAKEVPVSVSVEAPTFSVTIPTGLPIDVSSTGDVTVANNAKITNNSHAATKVSNLSITGASGWNTLDFDSFHLTYPVV